MRKSRLFIVLAGGALLLGACASGGESFSDRFAGSSHVQGDAEHVKIFQASSAADALPLAIGHCAHFGKSAQYASHDDTTFTFKCVSG